MNSIINFSEAASIALHGIIIIAKSEKYTNVTDLAEVLGSSKHHVAKIMQRLAKSNYIVSLRGPRGGFVLKKKPEDISFLDIYVAIEGEIIPQNCPFGRESICSFDKCILNNVTHQMTKDFVKYLESQTVDKYI